MIEENFWEGQGDDYCFRAHFWGQGEYGEVDHCDDGQKPIT